MTAADSNQLSLAIDPNLRRGRVPARVRLMHPSIGHGPFDDSDYFFEPWWPGSRALLYVDGSDVRVESEHLADPLVAFPELGTIGAQVRAEALVLDGTLMVLDDAGRPDADLLRRRLASSSADDVPGVPAFVATDLLFLDDRALAPRPFSERRDRLSTLLPDGEYCVVGRGYRREGTMVAEALSRMGVDAMSARRLSARHVAGDAGDAWFRVPLIPAPTPTERPTLTLIQRLPI